MTPARANVVLPIYGQYDDEAKLWIYFAIVETEDGKELMRQNIKCKTRATAISLGRRHLERIFEVADLVSIWEDWAYKQEECPDLQVEKHCGN